MDLPWIHIMGGIKNLLLDLLFMDRFMPFMDTRVLNRNAPSRVLFFGFDFVIFMHL